MVTGTSDRKKHWDGNCNPILSYFDMRMYYRGDPESLRILSQYPPYKYGVSPEVEIEFRKQDPKQIKVTVRYPARVTSKVYFIDDQAVDSLRLCFAGKKRHWSGKVVGEKIFLLKRGFLYKLPDPRYGWKSLQ